MNPRLKSSTKWTQFPQEYLSQIEDVFMQNFSEQLGEAKVVVQGRIYPEEILLRVGFGNDKDLRQANFEVSVGHSPTTKNSMDSIHLAVDAAASMMADYFEQISKQIDETELDFPITWQEYDFEGTKVHLQFSTVNTRLEDAADALLGEESDEMVKAEPTMMGGGRKKKKDDLH